MSLSWVKTQMRQFLTTRCPADSEESTITAPQEVVTIDVPAGDLKGDADWDFADLIGGSNVDSRTSIRCDYGHVREACSASNDSVPSSVADLLLLTVRGAEEMSRASTTEVFVGALESTLSSNNTSIRESGGQFTSRNLQFDAPAAEVVSTKLRLRFFNDTVILTRK